MKNLFLLPILLLSLISFSSWGADWGKGSAAYQSGDYATALREWVPLAELGDVDCQTLVGVIYDLGQGVPQDYKTAVKWYTLAAEQGDALAQYYLGMMHNLGRGVPQDYKTAVKWFTLAAEQGDAEVQTNLGVLYGQGQGVPKSAVYAHMWGNIGSSNGNQIGGENRDAAAQQMTPSQIEEAQKLARECVAKNYRGC
jgi:uncharacterized protein